jgi:RND family efflux transporter MFP subunit
LPGEVEPLGYSADFRTEPASVDLEPLKIDRGEPTKVRSRRSPWFGRLVGLAVLAVLLVLFWRPLFRLVDRMRLSEVAVLTVARTRPGASAAMTGTSANGYVVARVRAALSADTPGRIVEMNVEEGSVVEKGDVVARLYADEVSSLAERAEADLEATRRVVDSRRAASEVASAVLTERGAALERAEADVAEADAALNLAVIERDRAVKLFEAGIAARELVDTAESEHERARARRESLAAGVAQAQSARHSAELELALAEAAVREAEALLPVKEAELRQAQATLEKMAVRAPFDGVVVLKDAEVGEVVSPNSQGGNSRGSVCTMVDFASLEVQVELPETSLAAAEIGEPATIFLDAYPDEAYPGRVLRIWPTANRQKATVEVRVGFDAPDQKLRPEMGARVVFTAAEPRPAEGGAELAILVPREVLVTVEAKPHVFVLERDVARLRPVELGTERAGRVQVRSGLVEGERVVVSPPDSLQDGERVLVKEAS